MKFPVVFSFLLNISVTFAHPMKVLLTHIVPRYIVMDLVRRCH